MEVDKKLFFPLSLNKVLIEDAKIIESSEPREMKNYKVTSPNLKEAHPTLFVFKDFSFDEVDDEFIEEFSQLFPKNI
jgi:hypothetical protein